MGSVCLCPRRLLTQQYAAGILREQLTRLSGETPGAYGVARWRPGMLGKAT